MRPAKFYASLDNIRNKSESKDYEVIAVFDEDDIYIEEYMKGLKEYPEVSVVLGKSNNKVHAYNRGAAVLKEFDVLMVHSDDMVITQLWFDVLIKEAIAAHAPDLDIFLHFPDANQKEKLCTYPIIGKKYYDRTGYIYNPSYESLFCDREEMEKAKALDKYVYVNKELFLHKHFRNKNAFKDMLMKRNDNREIYQRDRMVYLDRKLKNFSNA